MERGACCKNRQRYLTAIEHSKIESHFATELTRVRCPYKGSNSCCQWRIEDSDHQQERQADREVKAAPSWDREELDRRHQEGEEEQVKSEDIGIESQANAKPEDRWDNDDDLERGQELAASDPSRVSFHSPQSCGQLDDFESRPMGGVPYVLGRIIAYAI